MHLKIIKYPNLIHLLRNKFIFLRKTFMLGSTLTTCSEKKIETDFLNDASIRVETKKKGKKSIISHFQTIQSGFKYTWVFPNDFLH